MKRSDCNQNPNVQAAAIVLLLGVLAAGVYDGSVVADENGRKSELITESAAGFVSGDVSIRTAGAKEEAEAAILFAREHHPELAVLLQQLRDADKKGFARALEQITGEMKRLERIRERTPHRYEYELESWKLDSQARLLMARWVVSHDDALQKQVRDLLRQRREMKAEQLKTEKARLQERLTVISKQLDETTRNLEKSLDDEWRQMVRKAGVKTGTVPPADKKSTDKKSTDAKPRLPRAK